MGFIKLVFRKVYPSGADLGGIAFSQCKLSTARSILTYRGSSDAVIFLGREPLLVLTCVESS